MNAYTYMVTCSDNTLYAGYTTEIEKRLQAHNAGKGAKYTSSRIPVSLAYCQIFPDKSDALKQEARLKRLSRSQKQAYCKVWAEEKIRLATISESNQILQMYNHNVCHSTATFAYTLPFQEEYATWVKQSISDYPFLVLEKQGQIIGFAYAHRWRKQKAFDWSVETSIYLCPDFVGIDREMRLYGTLLALLKEQGIYKAYAILAYPNPASEAIHKKMGFEKLDFQSNCSWKMGNWLGNTLWGRSLHTREKESFSICPFSEVSYQTIQTILQFA